MLKGILTRYPFVRASFLAGTSGDAFATTGIEGTIFANMGFSEVSGFEIRLGASNG
jgi:hypothetical protein